MRVLHVYRTYFPDPEGGVPEAVRQICRATGEYGVTSTVFCLSPSPLPATILTDIATVTRDRSFAAPASCDLGGPSAFRAFAQLAAAHDVIHYHFPWPFADLLHLVVRPRAPAVLTYHSDIVRQSLLAPLYAPLMWKMLTRMRAIIATSPQYADTSPILSHARIRDRVRVVPLGVGDEFRSCPADSAPHNVPYLLFVGVPRYYKGLTTLIEAAGRVKGRIVIAGDGPQRSDLEQLVRRKGLTNVEFVGRVSEEQKHRLLAGCRALVLPSDQRSEAFGMALVEASIFGRPMITCEIGTGTSFVNVDGTTGLIVPPRDSLALAAAMNTLLEDRKLAERLGAAARSRYEQLFSLDALGREHRALYDSLIPGALPVC